MTPASAPLRARPPVVPAVGALPGGLGAQDFCRPGQPECPRPLPALHSEPQVLWEPRDGGAARPVTAGSGNGTDAGRRGGGCPGPTPSRLGAGVTRGHVGLLSPRKWPTGALGSGLGFVGDAWGARGGRFQSGGVRVTRGVPSLASAAPGPPVSVLSAGDSAPASLAGPWSWLDAPPPPGASVISLLALLVEARMLLT